MAKRASNGQRIGDFADELKLPVAVLLEQLKKASVKKSGADDPLSDDDKSKLLDYLRAVQKETRSKVSLTGKKVGVIRTPLSDLGIRELPAYGYEGITELVRRCKTSSAVKRAEIRATLSEQGKSLFDQMMLQTGSEPRPSFRFAPAPVHRQPALAVPSKSGGPIAPDLYKAVKASENFSELEARIRATQDAAYRDD